MSIYYIPSHPERFYKEWPGWDEFLGLKTRVQRSFADWQEIAERVAAENGGRLPTRRTIIKMGYRGLAESLTKYPDRFLHLQPERGKRTLEECVALAEDLASQHGGLPTSGEMERDNKSLAAVIRRNPGAFEHIPRQEKRRRTIEEQAERYRAIVRELGRPPDRKWFDANRETGLRLAILRHPDRFRLAAEEAAC